MFCEHREQELKPADKKLAKFDAARLAVTELVHRDLLNEVYSALNSRVSELGDDADDFQADCGLRQEWTCRSPHFWNSCPVQDLFLTRIHTNRIGNVHFADLLIITKGKAMPSLPPLPFYNKDEIFSISCCNLEGSITISEAQLEVLTGFTNRLLKVMINKKFTSIPKNHVRKPPNSSPAD